MKKLRQKFNRFCYQHRNWGIPNLMLYITIGNAIVYLMSEMSGQPIEKVKQDVERDYFMSAEEAKEYGLIDQIFVKRP